MPKTFVEELAELTAKMNAMIPENAQVAMAECGQELLNSGIVDQALKTGDKIPHFALPNATEQTIQINSILATGPVVLSFYRGGWCPYCNLELAALQQIMPDLKAQCANLVAISPQSPDHSLSTVEKHNLSFQVLSDLGNQVSRQFGLVFTVPEKLRPVYQQLGIDLPEYNGDQLFELPLPATYIVNSDGEIVYDFINADYKQRLDPTKILTILKEMKSKV